jgi:hypothetical protein
VACSFLAADNLQEKDALFVPLIIAYNKEEA